MEQSSLKLKIKNPQPAIEIEEDLEPEPLREEIVKELNKLENQLEQITSLQNY